MLKKICSYCEAELEPPVDDGNANETISHGICRPCVDHLMAGSGTLLQEFIDTIEIPVFVLGDNARVVSANKDAEKYLEKDASEMSGHLNGEVFDCINHTLPGGCGQTEHCKTCTIRNSIEETYKSGKALKDVPAYLDLDNMGGTKRTAFKISTEKRNEVVLLNIEEVSSV